MAGRKSVKTARAKVLAVKSAGVRAKGKSRVGSDLAPARIQAILKGLDEAYPEAVCALTHRTPWELLVATILSAQ
jgi:endonuclease-3